MHGSQNLAGFGVAAVTPTALALVEARAALCPGLSRAHGDERTLPWVLTRHRVLVVVASPLGPEVYSWEVGADWGGSSCLGAVV